MLNRLGVGGFLAASLFLASSSSALAYLDPGTGAIILQVLVGGVAGAAMIAKLYWSRLMDMVGRVTGKPPRHDVPSSHRETPEATKE
jgi:hypothetical protein